MQFSYDRMHRYFTRANLMIRCREMGNSPAILDDDVGVVLDHLGGEVKRSLRDSFIMLDSRYKATVFNSIFS